VDSLKTDNIVSSDALTLKDLGVMPTDMNMVLPDYLDKFRPGGKFGVQQKAV
jgi:NADH dehydrogenase